MNDDELTLKLYACGVLAAAILIACPNPTPPNPPPQPDATDAAPLIQEAAPAPPPPATVDASPDVCRSACSNMATLKCAGVVDSCPTTLANIERDRLIANDAGRSVTCRCIAQAATKAGVEACGIGCR